MVNRPEKSIRFEASNRIAIGLRMFVATATIAVALPWPIQAQDNPLPAGFESQPLLKTKVTRDDQPIVYPAGSPELVSVIGTIQPGGRTPLHLHPVPVYVYVLEGNVELRSDGGPPHRYKTGEAYVEALDRSHQLFNVGDTPARVLVVFIGAEGKPTTVAAGQ